MNSQNSFSEGPFVYIGVEMICFLIITRFLLKYKYFKHHFLSIIAFVILGNVCDLILEYYPQMLEEKPLVIIFEFINIIIDVIFYTSEKYLMEILYYPYWKLNITIGSILFVVSSCLLIFALSAKGSRNFPRSDTKLYFLAILPSKKSVNIARAANIKIIKLPSDRYGKLAKTYISLNAVKA